MWFLIIVQVKGVCVYNSVCMSVLKYRGEHVCAGH